MCRDCTVVEFTFNILNYNFPLLFGHSMSLHRHGEIIKLQSIYSLKKHNTYFTFWKVLPKHEMIVYNDWRTSQTRGVVLCMWLNSHISLANLSGGMSISPEELLLWKSFSLYFAPFIFGKLQILRLNFSSTSSSTQKRENLVILALTRLMLFIGMSFDRREWNRGERYFCEGILI